MVGHSSGCRALVVTIVPADITKVASLFRVTFNVLTLLTGKLGIYSVKTPTDSVLGDYTTWKDFQLSKG